ncbi:MAG: hypothetical protein RIA65_18455 [Woeseia sp.]
MADAETKRFARNAKLFADAGEEMLKLLITESVRHMRHEYGH